MKKFLFGLLSAVMLVVLAVSCKGDKTPEEQDAALASGSVYNCVPANALVVAEVNLKSLFDKAGIAQMPEFQDLINQARQSVPSTELEEIFNKIVNDPTETGIDVTKPALVALTSVQPASCLLVVPMKSKDKLTKLINSLPMDKVLKLKEENGCTVLDLGEREVSIAYNNSALVVSADERSAKSATSFLKLDAKSSLASVAQAADFVNSKADMAVFVNAEAIFKSVPEMSREFKSDYFKDSYGLMTLSFEKGEVVFGTKNYINPEMQQFMNVAKKASGKFLDKAPANSYVVLNTAISGLGDMMSKVGGKEYAQACAELEGELGVKVKDVLNSFNGDFMMFAAPHVGYEVPYFGLCAEQKDRTIWNLISSAIEENNPEGIVKNGSDSYLLTYPNADLGATYELRFENNAIVLEPQGFVCRPSIRSTQYAGLFDFAGVLVNFESLLQDPSLKRKVARDNESMQLYDIAAKSLVALTGKGFDPTAGELKLVVNTNKNVLAYLIDLGQQIAEIEQSRRSRYYDYDYDYSYDEYEVEEAEAEVEYDDWDF